MQIEVYAMCRDYFERSFTLDEPVSSLDELRSALLNINPQAGEILQLSRFAANDSFIDENYILQSNDQISIIPPSSGG